ncbi:MAG: SAM-dependent methyltransferase [Pontibacterium sp.]
MELKQVVPWGRSFAEYQRMFGLTKGDLSKRILGCGDGPASFNAELTAQGGHVVSVDPTYVFDAKQLAERIDEVYAEIMPQMEATQGKYIWDDIASVAALGEVRMAAMQQFLADFEQGKTDQRYLAGALPNLPFDDDTFDLALCSHFLFLYSEQVDQEAHIAAMCELVRVAKEVRVYPLVTLKGELSPYLNPVMEALAAQGCECELVESEYRFQQGATQVLVVKK